MLVFILALIYAAGSSGMLVNLHYCMGDLAAATLGFPADDECPACGAEGGDDCCRNDVQRLQATHDQPTAVPEISFTTVAELPLKPAPWATRLLVQPDRKLPGFSGSPPLLKDRQAFLCVYRN